jgi:hypothetical protein
MRRHTEDNLEPPFTLVEDNFCARYLSITLTLSLPWSGFLLPWGLVVLTGGYALVPARQRPTVNTMPESYI